MKGLSPQGGADPVFDEKDIFKMVARRSYPTLYLVRPKHIRNIWKGFNLAAGKAAEE